MSELEHLVRDALHRRGETVTPGLLRHGAGAGASPTPPPRRRGWPSWLAPVAAALSILIVVAVAAVVSRGGSSGEHTGSDRPAAALAGTDWRLIQVRRPDGRQVDVPDRVGADIAFERDGKRLDGSDGVNRYSTSYTVTEAGALRLAPVVASAIGYAGNDSAVLAAVAGIGAVLSDQHAVSVQLDGKQLRLRAAGYTLVFSAGAPPATSSAAPTP